MIATLVAAVVVSATNLVVESSARYAWAGVQNCGKTICVPASNSIGRAHWEFTLGAVRNDRAENDTDVLASMFVTPKPDKFIHGRVYSMVPALVVQVKPIAGTYDVSLWLKNAATSGLGFNCLFEGRYVEKPKGDFTIGVDFNRGLYRIRTDRMISTLRGAISGRCDFSHPDWEHPVYAGAYAENDANDRHAVVELRGISLTDGGTFPEEAFRAKSKAEPVLAERRTEVRVRPNCAYEVNGFDEVQSIFNGNVNGDDRGSATHLVKMLNLNGARAFLQTGGQPGFPRTRGAFRQFGGQKPLEGAAYDKALADFWAQDFEATLPSALGNAEIGFRNDQARQLGYFRDLGLVDNIVFLPAPIDGTSLAHKDAVCRYFSAYIRAIRKVAPWLKGFSLQYVNEPNYPWFSSDFDDDQRRASAACLELHNLIDGHLRTSHPEVKLIGPCLAENSFPFYHLWVRPFLSGARHPMEVWNYHSYDTPQWSHLAWMALYQAEAERLGRIRPQGYCTEMAYALGKKDLDGDRMVWEAQQLMTALENPDKWKGLSWHMLVMDWFNSSNVIRKDWLGEKNERIECYAGSLWELFHAFNRVRGKYVSAESDDDQVRAVAVRYDPTLVSVVLFNDGPARRRVAVKVDGGTVPDRIRRVRRVSTRAVSATFSQYAEGNEIDLASGELVTLEYRGKFPAVARTRSRREFYGDVCGRFFSGKVETAIRLPEVRPHATHLLRFAIGVTDPLFSRRGKWSLNGKTVDLDWTMHKRGLLHDTADVLLFEMPLEAALLTTENRFTLETDDADYHFMFASIVETDHD